jgi:hypothetical protein
MLLRAKYDVVESEIRCFDKCHVGLFRPRIVYLIPPIRQTDISCERMAAPPCWKQGIVFHYNIYSTYIEIRLVETIPRDIYQNIVFRSRGIKYTIRP